jgi:hypothetical protein
VPELAPVRHGRMLVSRFTFFQGAALPMAADLATTPTSGLRVQLCGDAHLSHFGAFASPERNLVFDVNDFDETLPGPFERDVKRLAASLAVASRDNGFGGKHRRQIVLAGVESYHAAMRAFAEQQFMDVWYAHLDIEQAIGQFRSQMKAKRFKATEKMLAKAHTSDSMQALGKLTTEVAGRRRIISDPPLIEPVEEIFADVQADAIYEQLRAVLGKYRRTLQSDRKHPAGILLAGPGSPQGGRGRQRRHPGRGSCSWTSETGPNPCSCRPKRPSRRFWRPTAGAASTATRASGLSPAST